MSAETAAAAAPPDPSGRAAASGPPAGPPGSSRPGSRPGPGPGPGPGLSPPAAEVRDALAFVLRSTQRRPQTAAELAHKLRRRDHPAEVVQEVLDRARALGAVDDAAFARAWVHDRGERRGFGVDRLRAELRRRLVPEPLVDGALGALEQRDDRAAATELAERRVATLPASLDPPAVARRLQAYLVRRGYPPSLAQGVAVTVSGLDRYRDWD